MTLNLISLPLKPPGDSFADLEVRVDNLAYALEVNILDYAYMGVDRGGAVLTNSTAGINQAIQDVSAEAAVRTLATGTASHGRIIFPRGTYLSDAIIPASNVTLELGEATIAKRSDSANNAATNNMFYAPEISSGVDGYYGNYQNFKIKGGYLDPNGKTAHGSLVRLLWMEHLEIDGLEWMGYADPHPSFGLSGTIALWYGGNYELIHNTSMRGSGSSLAIHNDGIHKVHGSHGSISNCYVECGDDALAIGPEPTASLLAQPDPLQFLAISNIAVKSWSGYSVKVYVPNGMTALTTDIDISNVVGTTGIIRNGGVWIQDLNALTLGTSQVRRVNVEGLDLKVGSTSHDHVSPYGVLVHDADEVSVQGRIEMVETAAAAGMTLGYVRNTSDVTLDLQCENLGRSGEASTAGLAAGISCRDTLRTTLRGHLRDGGTSADLPILGLWDCPGARCENLILENIQDGAHGILTTGTTTTLDYFGGYIGHAAGATTGRALSVATTTCVELSVIGVNMMDCAQSVLGANVVQGGQLRNNPGISNIVPVPTIASAATITPSLSCDIMFISGTADITSITATNFYGRRITLIFQATAATNGIVDGSNLLLQSTMLYTASDTITLVCNNTNWYEVSRSVN